MDSSSDSSVASSTIRSTLWRHKVRESNPERHEAYLQKQREAYKQRKEKKLEYWSLGTRQSIEDREAFYEQKRKSNRKSFWKKKNEKTRSTRTMSICPQGSKRVDRKSMTDEERRVHDNNKRKERQAAMSRQKKTANKRARAAYMRDWRLKQKKDCTVQPTNTTPMPFTPRALEVQIVATPPIEPQPSISTDVSFPTPLSTYTPKTPEKMRRPTDTMDSWEDDMHTGSPIMLDSDDDFEEEDEFADAFGDESVDIPEDRLKECEGLQKYEIDFLKSVYCKDGEIEVTYDSSGCHIIINLQIELPDETAAACGSTHTSATVSLSLCKRYPKFSFPGIRVDMPALPEKDYAWVEDDIWSYLFPRRGWISLLNDVVQNAQEYLEQALCDEPQNIILSAISKPKIGKNKCTSNSSSAAVGTVDSGKTKSTKNSTDSVKSPKSECGSQATNKPGLEKRVDDVPTTCLLRLDHMRSKASYSKVIAKWAGELTLTGRLIFYQRLILIVLQGSGDDIKQYIVRNRTTNVDVDSKGKNCKERMLSVLCEESVPVDVRIEEFSVVELTSIQDMAALFKGWSLDGLYKNHVESLLSTPNNTLRKSSRNKTK